ncbi:retinitis pigmentosa 1-like 1 protein [Drosophila montana]|uniref:retinitis pigmentosa 1-like 1 protein n=1 Tax=Drosophila montana TaxID=40370 RepID=UPI00313C0655
MAIAESHLLGSCKAVPGRCYNRNRSHTPAHAPSPSSSSSLLLLLLSLLLMMLAAMPTSCLAQTSESTTLPSVDTEEVTTVNPPQQPVNEPHVAAVNETNVRLEPEETAAAEVADEFAHTSFVALGGEGLEQGIRNAVKSEVESEIEADSSALVETLQVDHKEDEHKTTSKNEEQTDAAQGVREPKTLETDVEKVEETDKVEEAEKGEEAKKAESTEIESESDNTQESVEAKEPAIAENSSDHVESKSDTEIDSSSAEANPVAAESRPLPSVTSDLVAVIFDENRAITEQPIAKTNLLALEREHEEFSEVETTPQPTLEVVPKHQVTKKQGVEDLLPMEIAQKQDEPQSAPEVEGQQAPEQDTAENARDERNLETAAESTSETSAQDQLNEIEKKEVDVQPATSSTAEPDYVASTEASPEQAVVEAVEETLPAEAEKDLSEDEQKPDPKEPSVAAAGEPSSSSSTAAPTESENEKIDESVEDESRDESDAEKGESGTEQGAVEPADKDSSEESEELSADEPKARAEDSTATPLVSYPPHNSGQTFVSNLADERSAHLSLASTSRSTLIIALCSGTAVLFIVFSLVIFVLSFQRQHGTLDIEMQEQRLGKDDLDQEDAQMKLLDVELSPPVIIAMGNEETDECL